jgi:tetratricopeptide (TPR) repeat protein
MQPLGKVMMMSAMTLATAVALMLSAGSIVKTMRPPAKQARLAAAAAVPEPDLFAQALAHGRQKDHAAEVAGYTAVLQRQPDRASALFNRAIAHWRLREYQHSVDDYTAYLANVPTGSEAYRGRAMSLIELKQFEAAIADADQAVERASAKISAVVTRAEARLQARQFDAALDDAERALAIDADDRCAKDLQLRVLRAMGRIHCRTEDLIAQVGGMPRLSLLAG